jgi:hypothetical protein
MTKIEALEMSLRLWEMRPTTLKQKKEYAFIVSDGKQLVWNCPLCEYVNEVSNNTSLDNSCDICPVIWSGNKESENMGKGGEYCCIKGAEYHEWLIAVNAVPLNAVAVEQAINRMIRAIKRGIESDRN